MPPDHTQMISSGIALRAAGDLDGAIGAFRSAIELKPTSPNAYSNLGLVLRDSRKYPEAVDALERAVELAPHLHHAHSNLGAVLRDQGRLERAVDCFRRAIALKPDYERAHTNLIYTLSFGQIVPHSEILSAARNFEASVCIAPSISNLVRSPRDGQKIRVAFISAEVGSHAVSYFLETYLRAYDRDRFEVTLYPTFEWNDTRGNALGSLCDHCTSLASVSDDEAQRKILHDGIDILIDTTSYMSGSCLRLLSRRCAPVQCHYIGFNGSSGIRAMDYFIGDDEVTPPELDFHFSEKVVRLPRLWMAYTPRAGAPEPSQESDADEVAFGCFNNLAKVREQCLTIWAGALAAVPGASLILKDRMAADPYTRDRITSFLGARGIAAHRIEFVESVASWHEHMALYNRVDIALDTIPLNSSTTGFDALFMGVPLIGIRGDWMGARMSSAMLKALGHPEWIANDALQFAHIAKDLASDRAKLKLYKRVLRAEVLNSALCDGWSLAAALEDSFREMVNARRKSSA